MMKASDIMTRDVVTIASSATVAEAIQLMQERGWRSLLVDRDHEADAYGIITQTDITCKVIASGHDPAHVQIREVMTKPCIVVNPDLSVDNVARLFINNRLLRAPVIQGTLLGIISISDILVKGELNQQLYQEWPQELQDQIHQARAIASQATPKPSSSLSSSSLSTMKSLEEQLGVSDSDPMYSEAKLELILSNLCSG